MRPSAVAFKSKVGERPVRILEIGVYRGRNALDLFHGFNVDRMYLIDRWEEIYEGGKYHVPQILDYMVETAKRFHNTNKVIMIRADSLDVDFFPPESLDYIYLDGDHSYPHVLQEIEKYWKVLKAGGMIGGDNFEIRDVDRAVREFFTPRSHDIETAVWKKASDGKTDVMDWWVWKR